MPRESLKDMVAYPAMMCCSDYPSTMCEHNVQPMTPCKSEAEFLPDAYAWAYCDLSATNPSKETCDATPDCKRNGAGATAKAKHLANSWEAISRAALARMR